MNMEINHLKSRLILNTDASTAGRINELFERGIIADFSEDGWVLYHKEWYPFNTFLERIKYV
jgi:predicted DNA-binding transcriptional regulator